MSLYSIISGVLFFLSAFGVFESVLKVNKINRFLASLFFLGSFVLYFFPNIYIWKFCINPSAFLYVGAGVFLLFRKNTFKGIVGGFLVLITTIAVLVVYYATSLNSNLGYVEPIVYLALVVGVVFAFCCNSFGNMFVGTLLGSAVFQLVRLSFGGFVYDDFVFFDNSILTFVLVVCVVYVFANGILFMVNSIKLKRQQKKLAN